MNLPSDKEKEFLAACASEQGAYLDVIRAIEEWHKRRFIRGCIGEKLPRFTNLSELGEKLDAVNLSEFFK